MNPIEYLYFNARFQPDDLALQGVAGAMTWRQLVAAVRGVAFRLRQVGVTPGQLALTFLDPKLDWVMTLALMHEATATCAAHGAIPLELDPDVFLAASAFRDVPAEKMIIVDESWFADLPAVPEDFAPRAFADDDLFRLILTSGTTGVMKAAMFSVDTFLQRCHRSVGPSAAELSMMGLSTAGGFLVGMRNLVRGVAFRYVRSPREAIDLIHACQLDLLLGSPQQLKGLVDELQHTSKRLGSLKWVWYGGAEAPPVLINDLRRDVCPVVICSYGSTEVGGVAWYQVHDPERPAGMTGYLVPDVEVQIVDDEDRPLPIGQEGIIRTKSKLMAAGYYKNPQETQRSFRDGWFYPGDRAGILKNGMLQLRGRELELINRGGVKLSPFEIDARILAHKGILDVATFGFESGRGVDEICAAVVTAADFDMAAFQRALGEMLPATQIPSMIIKIKEIPRNAMGKAMRLKLREQYGPQLRERSKATG